MKLLDVTPGSRVRLHATAKEGSIIATHEDDEARLWAWVEWDMAPASVVRVGDLSPGSPPVTSVTIQVNAAEAARLAADWGMDEEDDYQMTHSKVLVRLAKALPRGFGS